MLNLKVTKPLSDTEAAYIAGFIDGEGSLFMVLERRKENRSGYRIAPVMDVSQVRTKVLDWIQERCGGRMREYQPQGENAQICSRLVWQPNQQRWLIPQLLPYLIVKREIAELMLEFLELTSSSCNYGKFNSERTWELYQRVRELNHRGTKPFVARPKPKSWDDIRPHKSRPVTACKIDGCDERKFAQGLCRKHHREKYLNKNEAGPKNCAHCDILMEEARPDQKYCGHSCQMKAYRRRKKAASSPENLPQDQSYD